MYVDKVSDQEKLVHLQGMVQSLENILNSKTHDANNSVGVNHQAYSIRGVTGMT